MGRFALILGLVLALPLAARAQDLCPVDAGAVLEKFRDRFPHEPCATLAQCPPALVESAQVLAVDACRRAAVARCEAAAAPNCATALTATWSQEAQSLRARLSRVWAAQDPSQVPPLSARRLAALLGPAAPTPACSDPSCARAQLSEAETLARLLARAVR